MIREFELIRLPLGVRKCGTDSILLIKGTDTKKVLNMQYFWSNRIPPLVVQKQKTKTKTRVLTIIEAM